MKINRSSHFRAAVIGGLGFTAIAAQVLAVPVNITQIDKNPLYNSFLGNGYGGLGDNLPGSGVNQEDQETEPGTVANQIWDNEGFFRDGNKLYLVGGYDYLNGGAGGRPGDLFIKVGAEPSGNPLSNPSGSTIANSPTYGTPGYTWSVDLSLDSSYTGYPGTYTTVPNFGSSLVVRKLSDSTIFDTVINDSFRSNPWKVNNATTAFASSTTTSYAYTTGLSDPFSAGFGGTLHNVLEIDLGFLGTIAAGQEVWFSYTMECGNDSIKGLTTSGFDRVPDSSASVLLISVALFLMAPFTFRSRR